MDGVIADAVMPAADRSGDRSGAIRDALHDAIVDRRLTPGTRLVEDEVGAVFAASRTVVRAALQALAFDGIVTIERNRGAFVARPSLEEARQVFAARRMIEPGLAAQAAVRATPADLAALRAHLAREAQAVAAPGAAGRRDGIRASGDFHLLVARIAGNPILLRLLRELVARSSLVIALYGRSSASSCARREHDAIVDALAAGDGARAATLIAEHLDHIEADLDDHAAEPGPLRDVLRRAAPPPG